MSKALRIALSLGATIVVGGLAFILYRQFIDPDGYAPIGVLSAVTYMTVWHLTGKQAAK